MMKDVADSRRLFNAIEKHPSVLTSPNRHHRPKIVPGIGPLKALIISELFWPTLQSDSLKLHPKVQSYASPTTLPNPSPLNVLLQL